MSAVIPLVRTAALQPEFCDPFIENVRAAYRNALEAAAAGDGKAMAQARVDYHLAVMAMAADHLARLDVVEGKR